MELRNFNTLKHDKGVAGLTIILSIVVFLFLIGFLTMLFALMGEELDQQVEDINTATEPNGPNISVAPNNLTYTAFVNSTLLALEDISCNLYNLTNHTDGSLIGTGNYSTGNVGGCYYILTSDAVASATINGSGFNASFSFTYTTDNLASGTIENTTTSLSSVVDWFDIVIVIGFMVVLILLMVLIISTIKGGGLLSAGESMGGSSGNIGSA